MNELAAHILLWAKHHVANGAGHDCDEWLKDGVCQLCGLRRRVHACPQCDCACYCSRGWKYLDTHPSAELNEVPVGECDCQHTGLTAID